jgi:hypothetical protein
LDDDLATALIRDLDRLERADPHAYRTDAVNLVELLGPRRPEAVPFLLRTSTIDQQHLDLPPRGFPVAIRALAQPADDPDLLHALADAASDPDPRIASAALAYLEPRSDPAIGQALAPLVARNALLGNYDFVRGPDSSLWIPPVRLAPTFATALRSCLNDAQRLRVLAAVYQTKTFETVPDDHPLVREIATLTDTPLPTPAVPLFRQLLRRHLTTAYKAVRDAQQADKPTPADVLATLKSDPRTLADALRPALESPDASTRLAVLNALTPLNPRTLMAISAVIERARYTDADPAVRQFAATLLGDDRAQALARVPDWIADCRADSPTLRETAARQLHESGLFPAPLTAALLRAVANRDMPAREGLLRALEQAHAAQSDPLANLQQAAAADDSTTRAYAKAALRDLDPAHQR